MPSKWNSEVIGKFLEIYKKYELLWNPKEEGFNNKRMRNVETNKLMQELLSNDIEIEDIDNLRKKIKVIKAVYRQELMKIENSIERGDGEVYKPKLVWYKKADYLKNVVSTANMELMIDPSDLHIVRKLDHGEEEMVEVVIDRSQSSLKLTPKRIPRQFLKRRRVDNIPSTHLNTNPPQIREMIKEMIQREEGESKYHQSTQNKIEDEYDNFGRHVAAQLRQLPVRSFIILQEKIQSLVTRERLEMMESETLTPVVVYTESIAQRNESGDDVMEHNYSQDLT